MEVFSYGLDQYRLYGVELVVVGFINLFRDYLDYYKMMGDYFVVKKRLFIDFLGVVFVLNVDISEFFVLRDFCYDKFFIIYGKVGKDL